MTLPSTSTISDPFPLLYCPPFPPIPRLPAEELRQAPSLFRKYSREISDAWRISTRKRNKTVWHRITHLFDTHCYLSITQEGIVTKKLLIGCVDYGDG